MSREQIEFEVDVASLVSLVGDAVDDLVLRALADAGLHGLRPAHGYVVQRLLAGPATATQIAAALGVTQQAVSKTVQELLRLGYVQPAPDADDRRRRPVELSATGRAAVAVSREARAAFARRLEAATGEGDLAAAVRTLTAALGVLGLTAGVRGRAVPPPGERS